MKSFFIVTPDEMQNFTFQGRDLKEAIQNGIETSWDFNMYIEEYGQVNPLTWYIEQIESEG